MQQYSERPHICPPHLYPLPPMGGEGRVRGFNRLRDIPLLLRSSISEKNTVIRAGRKAGSKKNGGSLTPISFQISTFFRAGGVFGEIG
jgi:hypothetical protein